MIATPFTPNYTYRATVVRWVDGDTVWLTVDVGFRITTTNDFRSYGINTPERGQLGYEEATARCNELAPAGSDVFITTYKNPDKYGRWLAKVFVGEININQTLINEGLAVSYFGGTR